MEISFCEARLCAVFNSYDLLCAQFGAEVAWVIAIRMSVLASATDLSAVPTKPPIELCAEANAYSVSLDRGRRLRFRPANGTSKKSLKLRSLEWSPKHPADCGRPMAEELSYAPDYAAAPGHLIQEQLDLLDISGRELARRCGRSPKLIAEIIAGKAPIEPETALQLERVLETPATIWLGMEARYRLHLARLKEQSALTRHVNWAKTFPLNELAKRNLPKLSADAAVQVQGVLTFFGCGNVEACQERFEELTAAAFRHSPSFESDQAALLAWLRIGDIRAEAIQAKEYDRTAFLAALREIRSLTLELIEKFLPKVERLCAEAGVVFVLEPALPKVALSGVSRWLSPRRALIQQTARHLTNDHFWFTFFHECAHLLLHSRKMIFLEGKDASNLDAELEAEADDWASNFLVPSEALTRFITRFTYGESEIVEFAASHHIAPGVVVGQLQHRKVLHYSQLNHLKERYEWAT